MTFILKWLSLIFLTNTRTCVSTYFLSNTTGRRLRSPDILADGFPYNVDRTSIRHGTRISRVQLYRTPEWVVVVTTKRDRRCVCFGIFEPNVVGTQAGSMVSIPVDRRIPDHW